MKLLFKQRLFSWFDSYDIYNEAGNTVYVVKGQLSWGHKLAIYDAYGNEVGMVVQKILTFLPKFEIYKNGSYIGCLSKEFSFLTQHSTSNNPISNKQDFSFITFIADLLIIHEFINSPFRKTAHSKDVRAAKNRLKLF